MRDEVKLGCVFTPTKTDPKGRPIRDPDSTSYVAAIEPAEEFGLRLYTAAWRRGWSQARNKVVLGDGAVWIWNLADQHFPGAVQIVDLYHARQHIWELARSLRELRPDNDKLAQQLANDAEYFERNAERMRYPRFRAQGLFVGSGVVGSPAGRSRQVLRLLLRGGIPRGPLRRDQALCHPHDAPLGSERAKAAAELERIMRRISESFEDVPPDELDAEIDRACRDVRRR